MVAVSNLTNPSTGTTTPLNSDPVFFKDEYDWFVEEYAADLPANFVTDEDIGQLGLTFKQFYPDVLSNTHGLVEYRYAYDVRNDYWYSWISIFHKDNYEIRPSVSLDNMPTQEERINVLLEHPNDYIGAYDKDGYYIYQFEDVTYVYDKGQLVEVVWNRGDVCIRFYCSYSGLCITGVIEDFCYKSRIEQGKAKINAVIPIASPAPAT